MPQEPPTPSARQAELLKAAYQYALTHGLTDVSLRPLAEAINSSPRVLLFLFGSKDGLVRALLSRARADELALLARAKAVLRDALLDLLATDDEKRLTDAVKHQLTLLQH